MRVHGVGAQALEGEGGLGLRAGVGQGLPHQTQVERTRGEQAGQQAEGAEFRDQGSVDAARLAFLGERAQPFGGEGAQLLAPGKLCRRCPGRSGAGCRRRPVRPGAAGYELSDEARQLLDDGDRRVYATAPHGDEGWVLAVFSVPESERQKRHVLRSRLAGLGFGTAAPGVWIAPARLYAETRHALGRLGLDSYVDFFRGEHLGFTPTAEAVARWWDLTAIAKEHEAFLDRHARVLHDWEQRTDTPPEEAYRDYLLALDSWRHLPYTDPGLPARLLPEDWPWHPLGGQFFRALHERLRDAGAHYAAMGRGRGSAGAAGNRVNIGGVPGGQPNSRSTAPVKSASRSRRFSWVTRRLRVRRLKANWRAAGRGTGPGPRTTPGWPWPLAGGGDDRTPLLLVGTEGLLEGGLLLQAGGECEGVLDGELGAGADGEVGGVGGVAEQDDVAVRPAFVDDRAEGGPRRLVGPERPAAEGVGEDLGAAGGGFRRRGPSKPADCQTSSRISTMTVEELGAYGYPCSCITPCSVSAISKRKASKAKSAASQM
ncbi:hypothetical protein SVIOM342S_06111 [Streptomyces violaceorubidus]